MMEDYRKHFVKIHQKAHRDLKIMSALTGRSMGDLIEEMIFRYKMDLTGGGDWNDDGRDLIAESEREIKKSKRDFEKRKEKAGNKRKVLEVIGKLRDEEGFTFEEIASRLQVDGYQTLTGKGGWMAGSVHRLYNERKDSSLPSLLDLIGKNAPYGGILNEEDDK